MPLTDRPEFQAWLARRQAHDRVLDRPSGDQAKCHGCGASADEQTILGDMCLVCLAGDFAADQVNENIAALVRAFVKAATDSDAYVLTGLVASVMHRLGDALDDHVASVAG